MKITTTQRLCAWRAFYIRRAGDPRVVFHLGFAPNVSNRRRPEIFGRLTPRRHFRFQLPAVRWRQTRSRAGRLLLLPLYRAQQRILYRVAYGPRRGPNGRRSRKA